MREPNRSVRTIAVVMLLAAAASGCFAISEDEFPLQVESGDSVTVPDGATWWLLTESQYDRALEIALEHELLLEEVELLKEQVDVLKIAQETRAEQLTVLQGGYDYYRGRYQDALNEMESLEIELAQERGLRRAITLVASGAALFAGGIFLGISLGQ